MQDKLVKPFQDSLVQAVKSEAVVVPPGPYAPYVLLDEMNSLNTDNWHVTENIGEYASFTDGQYLRTGAPTEGGGSSLYSNTEFLLPSDFEIQCGFEVTGMGAISDPTMANFEMRILEIDKFGDAFRLYIRRNDAGTNLEWEVDDDGAKTQYGNLGSAHTSTMRMVRVGSTMTAWIWANDQWEWNGNTAGFTAAQVYSGSVSVLLGHHTGSEPSFGYLNCGIDWFKVVSGAITVL